jgi:hypothetical protein
MIKSAEDAERLIGLIEERQVLDGEAIELIRTLRDGISSPGGPPERLECFGHAHRLQEALL